MSYKINKVNKVNKVKFREKWQTTLDSNPFAQSLKPQQPAIEEYAKSIEWSDLDLVASHSIDDIYRLMKTLMHNGYQVTFRTPRFPGADQHLAKYRNNGVQVSPKLPASELSKRNEKITVGNLTTTRITPVFEKIADDICFESENANLSSAKIAILAHWSLDNSLSTSTQRLIEELLRCDFEVLLVSACESKERLILSPHVLNRITVLRKPNYGYDFGSWSVGLQAFPQVRFAEEVLLVNDSMAGPFGSLKNILKDARSSPFDVTGLCDSIQIQYHLQSFFFHFKNGSLSENSIWHFWCTVSHYQNKDDIIRQYEIGFTEMAAKTVRLGALFPFNLTKDRWGASTYSSAKAFVELGIPFLKRELIRNLSITQYLELRNLVGERFNLDETKTQDLFGSVVNEKKDSKQN